MLNRLPRHFPPLSVMLDDMGRPAPAHVARALGVSVRSVRRWMAADAAPRPVMLALFWVTRWGLSAVDAQATNDARLHAGMSASLRREVDELRAQLLHVLSLCEAGAANAPLFRVHGHPQQQARQGGGRDIPKAGRVRVPVANVVQLFADAGEGGRSEGERA